MKVKVSPSQVAGSVAIPSSKSLAHRAIICASLAQGTSTVSNITYSKDIDATIACMEALGAKIKKQETSCIITGTNVKNRTEPVSMDCNESGSTLRFLIPLCALSNQKATLIGHGRLMQRPMDVYAKIFKEQQLSFKQTDHMEVCGPLQPSVYKIRGDISSQFITGLLLALPLLAQDSQIEIIPPYESKSYVDLTLQMLKTFGIIIHQTDATHYQIPGHQSYLAKDVRVEGDWSQAAFYTVLGAIQGPLTLNNMKADSLQGDKVVIDAIHNKTWQQDHLIIDRAPLVGQTIDLANCPDLGPILCILAAYSQGTTHLIHAQRLRMKESDRIAAMEEELRKWNVDVSSTYDTITIVGKETYRKDGVEIHGHNDHRIVMAMTIFGLCAQSPCIIDDAQAITKSYPNFFQDIQAIDGKVEIL